MTGFASVRTKISIILSLLWLEFCSCWLCVCLLSPAVGESQQGFDACWSIFEALMWPDVTHELQESPVLQD